MNGISIRGGGGVENERGSELDHPAISRGRFEALVATRLSPIVCQIVFRVCPCAFVYLSYKLVLQTRKQVQRSSQLILSLLLNPVCLTLPADQLLPGQHFILPQ